MNSTRLTEKEILEVFDKLNIQNIEHTSKFEVWEIPPLKRGTRISTSTSLKND